MKGYGFIIQAVCVLIAASIVGNWFLAELRKSKTCGKPWYAVYLTPPGILIVVVILLVPVIVGLRM
jgi:hypothetical protein